MRVMQQDRLALDRASVRTIDPDSGHLHVAVTNISKANICPYNGSEIPRADVLGLDPRRVYQLLRDPDELAKGASTFNGKPLLIVHKPAFASDHDHEIVVGSVGNDVTFEAPYLKASMTVWDAAAIAGIESREQSELSCGYFYDADMTPGEFGGVSYDGVMRNIRGNHVALVDAGRAGADVMVGDAAHPSQHKEPTMAKQSSALSRKALLASGALRAYLKPKLAQDQRVDLGPVLAGVTAKNWSTKKPAIKADLITRTRGKLAQDADLEDVIEMLDTLDSVTDEVADVIEPGSTSVSPAVDDDGDMTARLREVLKAKGMSDEDIEAVLAAMKPEVTADPAAPAAADAPLPVAKPLGAKDADKNEKPVNKAAMDAAIGVATKLASDAAVTATIAKMNAIREAERLVRPFVGEITAAMDSADAVYKMALDAANVDVTGVHPSAYPALIGMLPKPGAAPVTASPVRVAMDASATARRAKMFPNANRLSAH